MNIGEKIYSLRKDQKLSQEQLAEKVGVTRQTISNWELNETVPDTNQLIALSKILNVSIDELVNNDVRSIMMNKVSNTEKLAGMVIKILKVIWKLIIIYGVFIFFMALAIIIYAACK